MVRGYVLLTTKNEIRTKQNQMVLTTIRLVWICCSVSLPYNNSCPFLACTCIGDPYLYWIHLSYSCMDSGKYSSLWLYHVL